MSKMLVYSYPGLTVRRLREFMVNLSMLEEILLYCGCYYGDKILLEDGGFIRLDSGQPTSTANFGDSQIRIICRSHCNLIERNIEI